MTLRTGIVVLMVGVPLAALLTASSGNSRQQSGGVVSYAKDVVPVIRKYCLPCHAEESRNSSELSLDTYALMMQGGKHGAPVVPAKPDESILIQKLLPDPPFGDTMPLKKRRRNAGGVEVKMTTEEIDLLKAWIRQGAMNN